MPDTTTSLRRKIDTVGERHSAFRTLEAVAALSIGQRGADLKRLMQDKLVEHRVFVNTHGQNMPEILDWMWGG